MAKVDLSEFHRYARPRKAPCKVGIAIAQLDEDDIVKLNAALDTDKNIINTQSIITWLEKRGHKGVPPMAVVNHRKELCSCFEDMP